jgi:hypothetical protein
MIHTLNELGETGNNLLTCGVMLATFAGWLAPWIGIAVGISAVALNAVKFIKAMREKDKYGNSLWGMFLDRFKKK